MNKENLLSIVEASEEKRHELLARIKDARAHFLKGVKDDPRLPGQVATLVISYEDAALAYPWPDIHPPSAEFRHDEKYAHIPHIEMGAFRDDMQANQVCIEDMGAKSSLLEDRFRLLV